MNLKNQINMKKDELSEKLKSLKLGNYQVIQFERSGDTNMQAVLLKSKARKQKMEELSVKLILLNEDSYQLVHEEVFKNKAEINFKIKGLNHCFLSFQYKSKELLYSINDKRFFVPRKK